MFQDLPERIAKRMQYLERLDAEHRKHPDMAHFDRLRQVPPATGKLLSLLAANTPDGIFLELGTSGGYSTLWLSLAARAAGRKIVTFEKSGAKLKLARETLKAAEVEHLVEIVPGDVTDHLAAYRNVAFCFLDVEKGVYLACYETVVPNLVPGGLLVADNVISHREDCAAMLKRALTDERVDALIVPVGSGLLVARKA
ncbi:MAG TPA: class I SAM-dependent methyltransferase [bacterium]|nr:class I SAM-dependent methyltransferase [bacterium]